MTAASSLSERPRSGLPVIDVSGSGRAAGQAYGETCRQLVRDHLGSVLERLAEGGMAPEEASRRALEFREPVERAAPRLAAEVDGIADGAGIEVGSAWLLQLRAEVAGLANPECTAFAAAPHRSATGQSLVALNADLPSGYRDLMVVLRQRPEDGPALLTVTPAGQLGHHGLNEAGVTVVANFLHCAGWRIGVPRYLWTRLALEETTADAAVKRIESVHRAASRNLLVADSSEVINLETTVHDAVRTSPSSGVIAHTNHYVTELSPHDTADANWLHNSRTRLRRVNELLQQHAQLSVEDAIAILRDRTDVPDAICHHAGDLEIDVATVCSTVIDISRRTAWIAADAPDLAVHRPYQFTD